MIYLIVCNYRPGAYKCLGAIIVHDGGKESGLACVCLDLCCTEYTNGDRKTSYSSHSIDQTKNR